MSVPEAQCAGVLYYRTHCTGPNMSVQEAQCAGVRYYRTHCTGPRYERPRGTVQASGTTGRTAQAPL